MPQQTIKELLSLIDSSVNEFVEGISPIQEQSYKRLIALTKDLKIDSDGNIKNSLENIRQIRKIKQELDVAIITRPYLKSVANFVNTFDAISVLQNDYFAKLTTKFTPKAVFEEVKKINVQLTIDNLTENGIGGAYTKTITDILKQNITTGGSYADFAEQLKRAVTGDESEDGALLKYAKQIATDSINQYNASYNAIITDDLGLVWYQYTGSLLTTSRPFCQKMVEKIFFHISEVEEMLNGVIGNSTVPINDKTGLPYGFIEGTNAASFFVNRGGYNCGHQIFATITEGVPQEIRDALEVSK